MSRTEDVIKTNIQKIPEPPKRYYPRFCGGDADQFVMIQSNTSLIISKRMTENSIEWSILS